METVPAACALAGRTGSSAAPVMIASAAMIRGEQGTKEPGRVFM
jgi:hypothetical protein